MSVIINPVQEIIKMHQPINCEIYYIIGLTLTYISNVMESGSLDGSWQVAYVCNVSQKQIIVWQLKCWKMCICTSKLSDHMN